VVQDVPSPWLIAIVAALAAVAWCDLLDVPHVLRDGALVLVPLLADLAVVAGVVALLRRWSAPDRQWTDLHRLALACGLMLVSMLLGFFFVTSSNPIDQLGQGIASLVAMALLAVFTWRLRRQRRASARMALPSA
jgi:hypothetical protein